MCTRNWCGAGPVCAEELEQTDVITGYAPALIDRYPRLSDDGTGFDVYFTLSRWGARDDPDDDGPDRLGNYRYMVDVFRTTIRPRSDLPPPPRRAAGRVP